MRAIWPTLTLAALIVGTGGCADPGLDPGPGTAGSSSPGAASSTGLPLDFSRTGGLVGVDEHASISIDGTVTLTRGGSGSEARPLDENAFAQLKQLLAAVPPAGPPSTPGSAGVCADGYVYQVRTPTWSAATDDCSIQRQPAIGPLVTLLTPLLEATTTPESGTASPR